MDNMKELLIKKYEQITGFEPIEEDFEKGKKNMMSKARNFKKLPRKHS